MLFHPMHDYYGTGDWLWSIFSTAVFIGLFAAAIMLLVRVFSGPRRQGPGPAPRSVGGPWYGPGAGEPAGSTGGGGVGGVGEAEGAERILAERYARGEISEEEYRGRLDVLRQLASPGWKTAQQQHQHRQAPAQPQPQPQPQPQSQSGQPVPTAPTVPSAQGSEDQGTPAQRTEEVKWRA